MWNFELTKNQNGVQLRRFKSEEPEKSLGNIECFNNIKLAKSSAHKLAIDYVKWNKINGGFIGIEMIKCLYCNNFRPRPNGVGEHIFPKSLGAEVKLKQVCSKCNSLAAKEIEDPFINSNQIKLIRNVYQIKKGNKPVQPLNLTYVYNNEKFHITINGNKVIIRNIMLKKEVSLESFSKSFTLEKGESARECAKILLATTSRIVPGFRNTEIGEKLYKLAFEGINQLVNDKINWSINLLNAPLVNKGNFIEIQEKSWNHHYILKENNNGDISICVALLFSFKLVVIISKTDSSFKPFKKLFKKYDRPLLKRISIDVTNGRTIIEGSIPGFEEYAK